MRFSQERFTPARSPRIVLLSSDLHPDACAAVGLPKALYAAETAFYYWRPANRRCCRHVSTARAATAGRHIMVRLDFFGATRPVRHQVSGMAQVAGNGKLMPFHFRHSKTPRAQKTWHWRELQWHTNATFGQG